MVDPVIKLRTEAEKELFSGVYRQIKGYSSKAAKFLKIKGAARYIIRGEDDAWPPHVDHPALYLQYNVPYCFVSQPYNLTTDQIQNTLDWARRHNMRVVMDGMSTHYPGRTMSVRFYTKETDKLQGF